MKIRIKDRGFTLLEILIALAILAITLVALYVAQGNSLLISAESEFLTTASFLAEQQMTEWKIELEEDMSKNQFPDDKQEMGDFEEPHAAYHWERTLRKVEIPLVPPETDDAATQLIFGQMKTVLDEISKSTREVKVRVFWGETEDDSQEYVLTTHIVKLK